MAKSWFDAIQSVLTLSVQVGALQSDVERLRERVEDHHDRIIKLELREDALAEKMAGLFSEVVDWVE